MTGRDHVRRALLAGAVVVAICALAPAAGANRPPAELETLGASLPTVANFPQAGLRPRSADRHGTDTARAPFPCADYRGRGLPATARWGEWTAEGRGRRVRLITFSYGDGRIDAAWRTLRRAVASCPAVLPLTGADGRRGTTTQIVRSTGARVIRFDVLTRADDGDRRWGVDRTIVYQRVGDAIQKAQVSRGDLTPGDRRLLGRLARVARTRYVAARAEAADDQARPEADDGQALGDVDAPLRAAIGALPPGRTLNVSIGDSFISGEAGRWRGNVTRHSNYRLIDVYGPEAYWDTPTGEAFPGCHRARGAEIHVPGTVGLNLACSGAITTSMFKLGKYKPGIDGGMVDPKTGRALPGQLTLLGAVAREARIGTIVLSIGGNDMGFSKVILSCAAAFAVPAPFAYGCRNTTSVRGRMSDEALAVMGRKVEAAIKRVHATMEGAGYTNGSWQMIVQNYPLPIATDNRYPETYASRLYEGSCPFYDADIRWIATRLPVMTAELAGAARRASADTGQPIRFMDLTDLFVGRELCAKGAEHVDQIPADQVLARAERVQMMRVFPPFGALEAIHPNQLGQQALQACLREALEGGRARSGRCDAPADWSQVDDDGLPLVRFSPGL